MQLIIDGHHLHSTDASDVFAVAGGLYWYCANHHGGQGSEEYRILSTLGYKPGACEHGPGDGSTDANVYAALARGELTVEEAEAFVWGTE